MGKVLTLSNKQREACVKKLVWWEECTSRLGCHELNASPWSLDSFNLLSDLVRLKWVIFNSTSQFSKPKGKYNTEYQPLGDIEIPFWSRNIFDACWCFCYEHFFKDKSTQVMPTLFTGQGDYNVAIERWRKWRDVLCYYIAKDTYPSMQPRLSEKWIRECPGTSEVNPVEKWLLDPNEETKARAELFLAPIQGEIAPPSNTDEGDSTNKKPNQNKKKTNTKGRPQKHDPEEDQKWCDSWNFGAYKSKKECAEHLGIPLKTLELSQDRHRKRITRKNQ